MIGSTTFLLVTLSLLVLQCQSFGIFSSRWSGSLDVKLRQSQCTIADNVKKYMNNVALESHDESLAIPNREDMHHLAYLLANMTDHLDSAPEVALTIASQEMGWLFSKDVPKLTQMLLTELPELRQDKVMMRAYMFLLDFLEAISKETAKRLKANQKVMRSLLEAAKVSESELNKFVADNSEKLLSPDFTVYLDSEIETAERDSPSESLLVTIKLRLLDEQGKKMGVDVTLLPKLAAEADPAELRRKTIQHLDSYDNMGKELFLQTLRIMMGELQKRYQQVDPILMYNLQEVEKITKGCLAGAAEAKQ